MDFHNLSLNLYDRWQKAQDALEASQLLERFFDKVQAYYCEAFLDDELTWNETVYGEEELQDFKDDAIKAGFTFTVQLVDED
tara:strand:- start:100 stop:345 length:246 start_codon:yes stop_codon:yes gene_type:complete